MNKRWAGRSAQVQLSRGMRSLVETAAGMEMKIMATTGWIGVLVVALTLAGCGTPSTPSDRAALVGLWAPTDASGMTVTFHEEGLFDYLYSAIIFRTNWELGDKGEIKFSVVGGSYSWTCHYQIEGAILMIDNGQAQACFMPPQPLSRRYTKVNGLHG